MGEEEKGEIIGAMRIEREEGGAERRMEDGDRSAPTSERRDGVKAIRRDGGDKKRERAKPNNIFMN